MMMLRIILSVISMSLIPVAYGCAVVSSSHEVPHSADLHTTAADLHSDECSE